MRSTSIKKEYESLQTAIFAIHRNYPHKGISRILAECFVVDYSNRTSARDLLDIFKGTPTSQLALHSNIPPPLSFVQFSKQYGTALKFGESEWILNLKTHSYAAVYLDEDAKIFVASSGNKLMTQQAFESVLLPELRGFIKKINISGAFEYKFERPNLVLETIEKSRD